MSYLVAQVFLPCPWALRSPSSIRQVTWLWGDVNYTSSHATILTLPLTVLKHCIRIYIKYC